MADLLRFVLELAQDPDARHRLRTSPEGVLAAEVGDAVDLAGEDVEAAVTWARDRLTGVQADRMRVTGTVRPLGDETPLDAARRTLLELCELLDDPPAEVVTLPHRELVPDPPPPATVARGGGAPVPTEPPGGRWLHPVISDDDP